MAKYRMVNTRFWNDNWIVGLDALERYLFLYLLTNEHTDISGVYELPMRAIATETGIDKEEMLPNMLARFEEADKILYRNGWIAIKNFYKHQHTSPTILKGIQTGLEKAPEELRKWVLSNSNLNLNYNLNSNLNLKASKDRVSFGNSGDKLGITKEKYPAKGRGWTKVGEKGLQRNFD